MQLIVARPLTFAGFAVHTAIKTDDRTVGQDSPTHGPLISPRLARLQHVIEHAGHLLPAQGPIKVFIHHNTLHAFEDSPFDEAVQKGAQIFGCHPYLPEDRYRQKLARGRIRTADLQVVLQEDLGDRADERILQFGTRIALRMAMLQHPLRLAPPAELRWYIAESDALTRFREEAPTAARERIIEETRHWVMRDVRAAKTNGHTAPHDQRMHAALASALQRYGESSIEKWTDETWEAFTLQTLWRVCRDGVQGIASFTPPPAAPIRHRDLLLEATGQDTDLLVHEVLIRFCAAFLDQGLSHWHLPGRERGFFQAFCHLYKQALGPPQPWMRGLHAELERACQSGLSPLESIQQSLELLGVEEAEWDAYIVATLLALRGWAGMIWQLETRGDRVAHPAPPGSLCEFLAIRLLLERVALTHVARQALHFQELAQLRSRVRAHIQVDSPPDDDQRAFLIFQLAQVLGWLPADLQRLAKQDWSNLVEEVESFSSLERRRIFHRAYERLYRVQTLDALSIRGQLPPRKPALPKFQTIHCIDEREESLRRHLEEVAPEVETFAVAGFFCVAMYYRGAAEAHFVPLCPVVVRPQHWVIEDVVYTLDELNRRRAKARRALGSASHQLHVGSRTFIGGALLAAIGSIASIPLVARVLFPRMTARIRQAFGRLVQPPPITKLQLERQEPAAGPEDGHVGYTVAEMATIAERVLRDIGLTTGFARLVFAIGHGSTSLNNPHESAHDCGACGGAVGGPNARAIAQIMNDSRVRGILKSRGLEIPDDTFFIGALHNTCDDSLTIYDLDRLPKSHQQLFEESHQQLETACDRDAHERCRRFEAAPLSISFTSARRHVEGRSQDLAEVRPEYGHATNSVCIVARRERTRGLYLDRRSFLMSYDPHQDDHEQAILTRILQAVVPVCAGISLEYYFSFVDPSGWGCGTKLPHNITSLLGVMDGAASDLRPGLPWQMVEVHEPMRLLFVIETKPEALLRIMQRNPGIDVLCRNDWVQVATLDPDSNAIHVLHNGKFERYQPEATELPHVRSSAEWYRGWRDHLGYALIES